MWFDEHPYIGIYLLGCVAAAMLSLFKAGLFWMIGWITKSNVAEKNLKKIQPPDKETFGEKAATFFTLLAISSAFSWLSVITAPFEIMWGLLKVLREVFASTPEAIKVLRWPLRNNPDMSREAVWAYFFALKLKVGEASPNVYGLLTELNELSEHYPYFDRKAALNQLNGLNVMSAEIISSALDRLSSFEEET